MASPKISRLRKHSLPELQQFAVALGIPVDGKTRVNLITAISSTTPAIAKDRLSPDQYKALCATRPRKPPTADAPLSGLPRSQYRFVSATVSTSALAQLRERYPRLSSQTIARTAIAEYLTYLANNPAPPPSPCDRPGTQITVTMSADTLNQIDQRLAPEQPRSDFVHQAIAYCLRISTDPLKLLS